MFVFVWNLDVSTCVHVCSRMCVCTCVCMLYFFISLLALYTSRSGVISYHLCT